MFQLQGHKVRVMKIEPKKVKIGEGDRDGIQITIKARLPNSALEMFDATGALRHALYAAGNPGEKAMKQAKIDGVDAVSDTPALTSTGAAIKTIPWHTEQSGCTLTIDYGAGGKSNIVLEEGTTKQTTIKLLEGGTIEAKTMFHGPTDKLKEDQLGKIHRLHQKDVKVDLAGPSIDQQQLEEGDGAAPAAGSKVTPIGALKAAEEKAQKGAQ